MILTDYPHKSVVRSFFSWTPSLRGSLWLLEVGRRSKLLANTDLKGWTTNWYTEGSSALPGHLKKKHVSLVNGRSGGQITAVLFSWNVMQLLPSGQRMDFTYSVASKWFIKASGRSNPVSDTGSILARSSSIDRMLWRTVMSTHLKKPKTIN